MCVGVGVGVGVGVVYLCVSVYVCMRVCVYVYVYVSTYKEGKRVKCCAVFFLHVCVHILISENVYM